MSGIIRPLLFGGTAMVVATPTLTAEEFFKLHGHESNVDLVRGHVVRYPMPGTIHGVVCFNAAMIFGLFIKQAKLGRVMGNDTLIRISADTARGADLCYVSYAKLPPGKSSEKMLEVPPDLVVEVRSPSNTWTDMVEKMLDYQHFGVPVVVIIDPETESASVYRSGTKQDIFEKNQTLTLPDVLPGFEVLVSRFFEE
ncbi:MAG: Uma2 family endonuclease [Planctomycetaceae bacterium]|nr:Uma2 family endonuclease [Planctomycetaceae bacterium]